MFALFTFKYIKFLQKSHTTSVLFQRKYCPKLIMSLNTKSSSCQYVPKNVLGSDFQFVSALRKSAITKLLANEGETEL